MRLVTTDIFIFKTKDEKIIDWKCQQREGFKENMNCNENYTYDQEEAAEMSEVHYE